ncbi:MAG TPA: ferrous iron transport protein B [Anaerolineae bacterium]|nr:ferrous iron transport protein B [Anaerolineae bacterium]
MAADRTHVQPPAGSAPPVLGPGQAVLSGEVTIIVALAGQPNVGKSTVFNLLTGLGQHVGNWPGKTVEQKTGVYRYNGTTIHLVDLPGTYSLTANSPEEVIARDYVIQAQPDVVVAIVNAASLERNLYLVAELLPLSRRLVVGLNMVDVAAAEGVSVEPQVLEAALGVPVVPMSARRNEGVRELIETVDRVARGEIACRPNLPEIRADHRQVLDEIHALVAGCVPAPYPADWIALKLLEGDVEVTAMMRDRCLPPERWEKVHTILMAHEDAILSVASGRYEWVGRMIRAAVIHPRAGQITLTERLDRWTTHPVWGLLLLTGALGLVFWLTFAIGTPLQELLDTVLLGSLSSFLTTALSGAPAWLSGLVVDGILGGAGTVVTFLPILILFFAILALMEDVGYMARAAFVMDRFMHLMGLHGKSFMPLFLGFGCNVPAVVGTRIIDSPKARLLTMLLAPLVPCAARLAVIVFLAPIFFAGAAPLVALGLIAFNLFVLGVVGALINKWVLRGERAAFIMELPLYHRPSLRTIGIQVWQNSSEFLRKAGSLILVMSVVVWALASLPNGDIQTSYLASAGRALEPVGALMGLDWRMLVALLSSFVAKENAIATLGILFGTGEAGVGLGSALQSALTPAAALAFLVVEMLFIPCAATVAVIKQESKSWIWTLMSVGMLLGLSLAAGILVYQIVRGW